MEDKKEKAIEDEAKNKDKIKNKFKIPLVCAGIAAVATILAAIIGIYSKTADNSFIIHGNVSGDGNIFGQDIHISNEKEGCVKLVPSISYDFQNFIKQDSQNIAARIQKTGKPNDEVFEQGCLIYFDYTNDSDTDIILQKFVFNAYDIETIEKPVLSAMEYTYDNQLYTSVSNSGWAVAEDIDIYFYDGNRILYQFFREEKLRLNIDKIDIGETVDYPVFGINDKFTTIEDEYYLELHHMISCQDEIWSSNDDGRMPYIFLLSDSTLDDGGDKGAADESIPYGLYIPTKENKYTVTHDFKGNIKEISIPPHSVLRLPFYFFVDKTCSMKMNMEFWTSYSKEPLVSDDYELNFEVSSIDIKTEKFNEIEYGEEIGYIYNGDSYNGPPVFEYKGQEISIFPYYIIEDYMKTQ